MYLNLLFLKFCINPATGVNMELFDIVLSALLLDLNKIYEKDKVVKEIDEIIGTVFNYNHYTTEEELIFRSDSVSLGKWKKKREENYKRGIEEIKNWNMEHGHEIEKNIERLDEKFENHFVKSIFNLIFSKQKNKTAGFYYKIKSLDLSVNNKDILNSLKETLFPVEELSLLENRSEIIRNYKDNFCKDNYYKDKNYKEDNCKDKNYKEEKYKEKNSKDANYKENDFKEEFRKVYNKVYNNFKNDLKNLINDTEDFLNEKIFIQSLTHLIFKHFFNVRIQNGSEEFSDISLYEHSLCTSAVAQALYLNKKYNESITDSKLKIKENEIVLCVLDISGIQKFIFNLEKSGVTGITKIVRGRSFFIQLLLEIAANYIINELNIYPVAKILNSGGKTYLLLPSIPDVKSILNNIKTTINYMLFNEFKDELFFNIAFANINVNDLILKPNFEYNKDLKNRNNTYDNNNSQNSINKSFQNNIYNNKTRNKLKKILTDLNDRLNDNKINKLSIFNQLMEDILKNPVFEIQNFNKEIGNHYKYNDEMKICPLCTKDYVVKLKMDNEEKEIKLCRKCYFFMMLGQVLTHSSFFYFKNYKKRINGKIDEESGKIDKSILFNYYIIYKKNNVFEFNFGNSNFKILFFKDKIKELNHSDSPDAIYGIFPDAQNSLFEYMFYPAFLPKFTEKDFNIDGVSEELIKNIYIENSSGEEDNELIRIGETKTFSDISLKIIKKYDFNSDKFKIYKSLNNLGIFKADVDNLGLIFQNGLSDDFFSLTRYIELSKRFDLLFSIYLPMYIKINYPDIYIVFSGGDDLFYIGNWEDILKFAVDLKNIFKEYTCNNQYLHFSAGISFIKPRVPLPRFYEEVEEKLDQSKNYGKNSINIFGVSYNYNKFIKKDGDRPFIDFGNISKIDLNDFDIDDMVKHPQNYDPVSFFYFLLKTGTVSNSFLYNIKKIKLMLKKFENDKNYVKGALYQSRFYYLTSRNITVKYLFDKLKNKNLFKNKNELFNKIFDSIRFIIEKENLKKSNIITDYILYRGREEEIK